MPSNMSKDRFQELLAKARSRRAQFDAAYAEMQDNLDANGVQEVDLSNLGVNNDPQTEEETEKVIEVLQEITEDISKDESTTHRTGVEASITLNEKQAEFNALVQTGKDCVLIGAAGTGKTTSMRQVTRTLLDSGRLPKMEHSTKYLKIGSPGAVILSYTRKAVNNIRRAVVEELKVHTLTIHKLLEFAPVYYEIVDKVGGGFKKTMKFEPQKNSTNPLPSELKWVGFEEASMISVELYKLLGDAMPHEHQEVFLGDIQQLPPIFGMAILGFKMSLLPVVELTEVYRQALNSPIISLAWKILEGNPYKFDSTTAVKDEMDYNAGKVRKKLVCPALQAIEAVNEYGTLKINIWQKKNLTSEYVLHATGLQFINWSEAGYYNPNEDIILMPFNKSFGTIELNKKIADYLGRKRGAEVYEVLAGFITHYIAVGDRVLYDKEDAFITEIHRNGAYLGKPVQAPSVNLDRWGMRNKSLTEEEIARAQEEDSAFDMEAIENFIALNLDKDEDSGRVQAASHVVHIKFSYSDEEVVLSTAADINNLLGGYAITVHKAQGSEWEKVFFLMHSSHAVMNQRELLYTAVTRARSFLHIICESDTFEKGVKSQSIKGNTLAQKIEVFKGKGAYLEMKMEEELLKNSRHELKSVEATAVSNEEQIPARIVNGQVAFKLEDVVPLNLKLRAQQELNKYWMQAKKLWPTCGEAPKLDYNLGSKNIIGRAKYLSGVIQLNPVWLAAGDAEVVEDICVDTVIHEICHFVAYRVFKHAGHGARWKLCMIAMGRPANRLGDVQMPNYIVSKQKMFEAVLEKFQQQISGSDEDSSKDDVEE